MRSTPLAALAVIVPLVAACSVVVDPDEPKRCIVGPSGADPCTLFGQVCDLSQNRCVSGIPPVDGGPGPDGTTCTPSEERCNQEDDDCDTRVDEGFDVDGDGVTWCGTGNAETERDCDDSNPGIYPTIPSLGTTGPPDTCDGVDNDCDLTIDEDPNCGGLDCFMGECRAGTDCTRSDVMCDATQRCDLESDPPECVTGRCPTTPCMGMDICDMETGSCLAPSMFAGPCVSDVQCPMGMLCAPNESLGLGASGGVCSYACCTDAECEDDAAICWNAGTGAKMCVSPAAIGRTRGGGANGAVCSADSECDSSICFASRCFGSCGNNADCAVMGQECGISSFRLAGSPVTQVGCRIPGTLGGGEECGDNNDCRSGLCAEIIPIFLYLCEPPNRACRTTADCSDLGSSFCGTTGGLSDRWQLCLQKNHSGTGAPGTSCTNADQCRDRACVEDTCASTCCSDADCSGLARCRPSSTGDLWRMVCVP